MRIVTIALGPEVGWPLEVGVALHSALIRGYHGHR